MNFTIFKQEKKELEDLNKAAEKVLCPWVKGGQILHLWDEGTTVLAVVKFDNEIHFYRAFSFFADVWHVSQDQIVNF